MRWIAARALHGNGARSVNALSPAAGLPLLPAALGFLQCSVQKTARIVQIFIRSRYMAKILVLYYSSWGHMEAMAKAAAEGAREAGAEVTIKRVAELVPEDVAKAAYYKLDQEAPIADPLELENYDGVILGVSTRYGAMAAQLKNFLDQTGPLWARGALVDKVATVMSSTATQHGGAELAIISAQASLQHHGMIIVPLSYAYQGQSGNDVVRGGSPYGMTTTSNTDGSRMPSDQELEGAHFQGGRIARIAAKLHG
jgi:NAD(P)H dehydrogenase (quinone)